MAEQKVMNRWPTVVGAILIQLALGAIYAWSVFTPALKEFGWTTAQTQFVFAAGLVFFAIVMVWAGKQMPKWGPRKLAMLGGTVLGLGYILGGIVSLGSPSPLALTLTIGVIGGSGIGLGYVVPIAVGMRWFPDKKGLITGLAVAGFGFGAMLWVKLAGAWGNLIETYGLGPTFIIYGVAFFLMVVVGGMWMVFPPEGPQPAGWTPPPPKQGQVAEGVNFNAAEMLRSPQYYMVFL
ncbi:MAG: MFS transporter, partial [Chitinivibrionales bacterium]|nr:MFS transporter [Chitinivibrionales bacterium]MBD3357474.1 MFS transporter [Chitinivibrionales bacterium]